MLYILWHAYAEREHSRAVACPPAIAPAAHQPDTSDSPMPVEQAKLKILQQLAIKPDSTQRQLAQALGISLGSVNYCLQALIDKGCVKMHNFQQQKNKAVYAYLLTPKGIREKMQLTAHFLERKMREFEALRAEIEALRAEVDAEAARQGGGSGV